MLATFRRPLLRTKLCSNHIIINNCASSTSWSSSEAPRRALWNVLFFGSDSVSLKSLEALHEKRGDLVGRLEVVTHKRSAVEGASKVGVWARKNDIVVHEWPHPKPLTEAILPWDFDIGVVVSFGYLIPRSLLQAFPKSMINMHPSLLPKYRGPAPIHHPLLNDDTETAISIITLHPTEFDKGEILQQQRVPIDPSDTHPTLEPRLASLGAEMVIDTLRRYDEVYAQRWSQDRLGIPATKARMLTTKDANMKWPDWTAAEVVGRWRAQPTKAYTFFRGKPVKLPLMKLVANPSGELPIDVQVGGLLWDKPSRSLMVKCKEGWVSVLEAHLPGKPKKPAEAFANGYGLKAYNTNNCFEYEDREATTEN